MTVRELNRDQLEELKQHYLTEMNGDNGTSYEELAFADNIVSDEEIYDAYADTIFTNDDFFCTAGTDGCNGDVRLNQAIKGAIDYIIDNITSPGYIPFESPRPSSTEMQLRRAVMDAMSKLNEAYKLAHQLGY